MYIYIYIHTHTHTHTCVYVWVYTQRHRHTQTYSVPAGARRLYAPVSKRLCTMPRPIDIDSPCECEHNNPDSLDARLFPSVVLASRLL